MRAMSEAPKDGTEIAVRHRGTWFRASYLDCAWQRQGPGGDPDIADCWRVNDEGPCLDIEAGEAEGWLPAADVFGKIQ